MRGYRERRRAGSGARPWLKTTPLRGASNAKLSFLCEGNRSVLRRPAPPLPRWPEGGHLCQLHVLPACKTPLLLSHVLLSLRALLTMRVAAHWIARPFGDHVKERTQNISLLNRTAGFKDTKLHKTKTIGWGIMEAGWEGILCKGSSMFILFYNQDIKRYLSWALDIFSGELRADISAPQEEVAPKIQMRALATPYPWASSCQSSILPLLLFSKIGLPEPHKRKCIFMSACSSKHSIILSNTKHLFFMGNSSGRLHLFLLPTALCFVLLKWG